MIFSSFCVFFLSENISNYSKWTVITDVKTKSVDTLTFPAVSFCLTKNWTKNNLETFELNDEVLAYCIFDKKKCKVDDFERIPTWHSSNGFRIEINCYRFNGGRDSFGNQQNLLNTTHIATGYEFRSLMNITKDSYIIYHINNNHYNPSEGELINGISPHNNVHSKIKKTVDDKLPEPYNPCLDKESIDKFDSKLVKEILGGNYEYRQVNCYDLCYQKHLESLAGLRNISLLQAFQKTSEFNRKDNCDNLCPLECDTVNFEISTIEHELSDKDLPKQFKRL